MKFLFFLILLVLCRQLQQQSQNSRDHWKLKIISFFPTNWIYTQSTNNIEGLSGTENAEVGGSPDNLEISFSS